MRSDRKLAALRVVKVVIGGEVFVLEKDFPHVTLWKAKEVEAVNFLEKKVKSGASFDVNQTAQLAISALQHVLGEEVKASELEVAVVTADNPNFRVISESEVEDHLTSISERD